MRLSVNELEALARKAAVGAGIEHGYAREASRALVWLQAAGIDAVPGLVAALQAWAHGSSALVSADRRGGLVVIAAGGGRTASFLYAAPALRDFAAALEPGGRIEALNVEQPGFALALLACPPSMGERVVTCTDPGTDAVLWVAALAAGKPPRMRGEPGDGSPGDLSVSCMPFTAVTTAERPLAIDMQGLFARGVVLDGTDYETLERFAGLTLVPDSEASRRHGAGAGLVDSD